MNKVVKSLLLSVSMIGVGHAVGGDGQDNPIKNKQSLVEIQFKNEGAVAPIKGEKELGKMLFCMQDMVTQAKEIDSFVDIMTDDDKQTYLKSLPGDDILKLTLLDGINGYPHGKTKDIKKVEINIDPNDHIFDILSQIVLDYFPFEQKYIGFQNEKKRESFLNLALNPETDSLFSSTLSEVEELQIKPDHFYYKIDAEFLRYLDLALFKDKYGKIYQKIMGKKNNLIRKEYEEISQEFQENNNNANANDKIKKATSVIENPTLTSLFSNLDTYFVNLDKLNLSNLYLKKVPNIKHGKLKILILDNNTIDISDNEEDLNLKFLNQNCPNLIQMHLKGNPIARWVGLDDYFKNNYPKIQLKK